VITNWKWVILHLQGINVNSPANFCVDSPITILIKICWLKNKYADWCLEMCLYHYLFHFWQFVWKKLSNAKVTDSKQTYYNPQQIHTQWIEIKEFTYSSSNSHMKAAHLIIDIISTNTVSVHKVGSPLTCTGATFWNIRIMLRTPVMTKLMCSDKISLSCYNSLSIMISTRAQSRVQVQCVTILEVLCNITKPLRQTKTVCIFSTKHNSNLSHLLHCVWASLREYNTHNS